MGKVTLRGHMLLFLPHVIRGGQQDLNYKDIMYLIFINYDDHVLIIFIKKEPIA